MTARSTPAQSTARATGQQRGGAASGTLLPDEARASEDRPDLPDGIGKTALAPINAQALQQLALAIGAANQPQQQPPAQQAPNNPGE
jgi:hypothetical protein